jgi:hypothetical protein
VCTVNEFRYITSEIDLQFPLNTKLQRIIMPRFESLFYEYGGVTAKQIIVMCALMRLNMKLPGSRKSLQLYVNLCRAARH